LHLHGRAGCDVDTSKAPICKQDNGDKATGEWDPGNDELDETLTVLVSSYPALSV
jgi:hypothetical protein